MPPAPTKLVPPLPLRKDGTPMANGTRPIIIRQNLWFLRRRGVHCLPCRAMKSCRAWSHSKRNSRDFLKSSSDSMMNVRSSKRKLGWLTPWSQTWMISSSRVQSRNTIISIVCSENNWMKRGGCRWYPPRFLSSKSIKNLQHSFWFTNRLIAKEEDFVYNMVEVVISERVKGYRLWE